MNLSIKYCLFHESLEGYWVLKSTAGWYQYNTGTGFAQEEIVVTSIDKEYHIKWSAPSILGRNASWSLWFHYTDIVQYWPFYQEMTIQINMSHVESASFESSGLTVAKWDKIVVMPLVIYHIKAS